MVSIVLTICLIGSVLTVTAVSQNESTQFQELTDKYWAWRLEDSPELATRVNVNKYNNRTERYDIEGLDERKATVDGFLKDLEGINRTYLTSGERNSFDVLHDTLSTYAAGYRWRFYGPMNPVNFLEGLWNNPNEFLPSTLVTFEDFNNYAERISGWAREAHSLIERMSKSIDMNTTNHLVSMDAVVSQIEDFLGDSELDCVIYKPFNDTLDNSSITEQNKVALRKSAVLSMKNLSVALMRVKDFVGEIYMNHTREGYGVGSLKDGKDYYKACLKWHLSIDMDPNEIHNLGLREVDRIHKKMQKILDRKSFTGSLREFFDVLNKNSSFIPVSSEDVISKFEDIIQKRVGPKLQNLFRDVPDMPVKVEPMTSDGAGGSYQFGSPDGTRPGVFYVNTFRPENNPTYTMVSLALHEADPGHHMQDIFSQSAKGLPDFRKVVDDSKYFSAPLHFPIYTAYLEGWALYSESLGEADYLDVYQDDFELMGRYSDEIFRGCRLVVDTGLHYFGWTREHAIEYMMNYTTSSRESTSIEIDRYITWPGQACAYKVGELKIKELRRHSKAILGKHFDIRDFHSVVLKNGAVPLNVLENLVEDWIKEKQQSVGAVTAVSQNASTQFQELTDKYWAWRLEDSPELATRVNVNKYNNRTERYDIEGLDERKATVDGFLKDLEGVNRTDLTPGERNSFDVLQDTLSTYAAGYRWRFYGPMNPVNFLEGLWNNPNEFLPSTLVTFEDFNNYAERISGWAREAHSLIERMNKSIDMNTTNHLVSMDAVVSQIEDFLGDSELDCVFYKPFNDTLDNSNITEQNKVALRKSAVLSMKNFSVALNQVKDFVGEIYLNHTREGYGVGSLKDGKDYYKACLKWHLSIDMDPTDIHNLGLKEVERIHKKMQKILDRKSFTGSLRGFFDALNKNSSFIPVSAEDVISKFEDIIQKRVGPKLQNLFRDVPEMRVKVEPMTSDGAGGSYQFGSPDGTRPGVFYVNTFRPENNPTYTMVSLALHEADPGHHMQDIFSQSAEGLPDFRKVVDDSKYFSTPLHFPFYTAYLEGWALYAESLGEADYLDVYQDDFELMGRYSHEIFRGCRLVVDTGLHYFGWTRERAIEYMMNYTTKSRESTSIEIDRYITWPGQACAYKVGELKIKELRRHSKAILGKHFDIRDFHSVVLKNGAVPLDVLENLVEDWIKGKQQSVRADFLNRTLGFHELVDEYWQWRLEDAPEFASSIQVKNYDAEAEQYTVEVLQIRKDTVDDYLSLLDKINRDTLNSTDKVSYDVLKDTLTTFSNGYAWKNYGTMNPVNFLEGFLTDPGFYGPTDPIEYADFDNYILRLYGFIGQVDEFITRMQVAFEENTTNYWVSMSRAIEPFEKFVNTSAKETSLLIPFIKALDNSTISAANRKSLTERGETAMSELQQKYRDLKDFIETEYHPKARQEFGVNSFKNGEEYYQACLKWHLSTNKTPEEIHQLGLDEVTRIHTEMMKVTERLNFTGTTADFFKSLNQEPRFFLNTSEEVINRFTEIIYKRVKPKLGKYFKNIPDKPVVVKEMPYDGPGGSYSFGTPDGSKPGVFYVNVKRPKDNPTYDMVALTLHEADPGHHLQDIYAQASKSMPLFRRVSDYTKYFAVPLHYPFYTAYTEGWALYAESLGEKEHLDIYADDYELMGRYSSEIFRACRLVVDTGLHHYNWTREESIQYMLNYTSYTKEAMEVEIDRYITWPGQACAYKIGELKIKELRAKAQLVLGEDFDMQDFHSVVLDNGAVPLDVLEQLVNDWINDVKFQSDTFEKISHDFFEWRKSDSPEFASLVSYKYNDKLNSYKYENFDKQRDEVLKLQQRLNRIDRDVLNKETRVSFDIFDDMLTTFLAGYKWKDYGALNPINFLDGWHVDFDGLPSSLPFDTQGDFINYVRRVELLSDQYQEMMNLTKRAILNEHTSHNASLLRVNKQLDVIITKNITDTVLYKPFIDYAVTLFGNGTELAHVQDRLKHGLQKLKDMLKQVSTFMTTEYIPTARPGLGIGTLPNGGDHYKACLKWHTSLDKSPTEVHNIGIDEVARIESRIRETMANLSYNSSWTIAELYQHMRSDEQFLISEPKETLAHFRDIIFKRIQPKIQDYFSHVPMLPLEVKASASDGIGGQYGSGSADGSRPGTFYANVFRPEYNPTFKMISLSLHEAIPGHHLAESYTQVSDLPNFRKYMEWKSYSVPYFFPFYNAYVEGWALYSEYLGEEMGIYENQYELLGRFSDEMHRACRLVVDTGIHHYNWTRKDAIDYMLNYTALTPESAAIEVDRYATWPGQACGYKMGEIKIRELRRKAENELGAKFDLRDFHYTVLKNGPMPLSVLETVVDEWTKVLKSRDTANVDVVRFTTGASDISRASFPGMFGLMTYLVAVIVILIHN